MVYGNMLCYITKTLTIQYEASPPAHQCWAGSSLRLSVLRHLARTAPEEDRHRVIGAALRPRAEWGRPVGHPKTTWLRTIDHGLQASVL